MKKQHLHNRQKNMRGEVVVEATILLPIAILCVILLLYVSILICQKAVLQAGLETTAVYFKNTLTDNYVQHAEQVTEEELSDGIGNIGNRYSAEKPLNPYSKIFLGSKKADKQAFEKYFSSVTGSMIFGEPAELTIDYSNWILFREIKLTAEQDIRLPIDFSIIGVDNTLHLSAAVRVAVANHDELIRNIDYGVDLIEDTKVGEMWKTAGDKIKSVYDTLKEKLH